jgi:ethanolamine ammonia-lyase large subunit
VIYAKINTTVGIVNTFCTRLTRDWAFDDLAKEQKENVNNALQYISGKNLSKDEPTVLLGDFEFVSLKKNSLTNILELSH